MSARVFPFTALAKVNQNSFVAPVVRSFVHYKLWRHLLDNKVVGEAPARAITH